ncbi:serine/threonine-protein phosphatase [Undibacterium jejuense]|uniref:Serine/threonine-protein phosphatase n=1 Tax=Undibacterium jejuense TaxID=1344949 RepID=A0A923KN74_9BURK|nr:serine/threonine-protein phosphatase [Undibacterium jejuense]
MDCKQCGEVLGTGFSFCEACGTAISVATESNLAGVQSNTISIACACGHAEFDVDSICENCGRKQQIIDFPDLQVLNAMTVSASHRGLQHTENQDAVAMRDSDGIFSLAVADGVSTACRSKEAAHVAVTTALASLQTHSDMRASQRLQIAVSAANDAICALPYDDHTLAEPEATIVLAMIEAGQLHYAWVGDSRLYVVRHENVVQLTEDDSWLNQQIKAGISINTALKDRNAHCITQCLGMRDDVPVIHFASMKLESDTAILLCSDGLWNYCDSPAMMLALFDSRLTVSEQCLRLVNLANQQGGHDNISVILHRYSPSV